MKDIARSILAVHSEAGRGEEAELEKLRALDAQISALKKKQREREEALEQEMAKLDM